MIAVIAKLPSLKSHTTVKKYKKKQAPSIPPVKVVKQGSVVVDLLALHPHRPPFGCCWPILYACSHQPSTRHVPRTRVMVVEVIRNCL